MPLPILSFSPGPYSSTLCCKYLCKYLCTSPHPSASQETHQLDLHLLTNCRVSGA